MSERITQELRDATTAGVPLSAFNGNVLEETLSVLRVDFESRCDAIDAIHANLERENDRLKCELDRVLGELDEMHKTDGISDNTSGFMQNAEHHAWAPESHYVMLPKDADGEPIHIGDKVTCARSVWEVTGLRLTGLAWGVCCTIFNDHGGSGTNVYPPCNLRHHHDPTVEDVLREMADRCYADEDEPRDRDAIVAEYAAKLQLRGDAQ